MPDQQCHGPRCTGGASGWAKRFKAAQGVWFNKHWYCSAACFEDAAAALFASFKLKAGPAHTQQHRLPIGLLMLSKGMINNQNLQEALSAQRESSSGRIGAWLRQKGIVTETQLTVALGIQWGLPVFQPAVKPDWAACAAMAPVRMMEVAHMVPVHYKPAVRTLYVAFSEGLDFGTLRALEQVLECTAQPCVISESEMTEALNAIRRAPRPGEAEVDCPPSSRALARMTREWVEANSPQDVRAALASKFIWVRIESGANPAHLLFRLPEPQPDVIP